MGYYISHINDTNIGVYIGGQTIYSLADAGAFDSPVSDENEKLCDENDHIVAIVEQSGVDHCLQVLRSGSASGRDIQLLINEIEQNYKKGFKLTQ